ncbi:hypothetical protein AYI68_g1632 [Smittium mucronatum]|uniref:Uncharacterized protein n=1 Tax=Smittium mucronatum TaxID=133383 RepID=A0A1R0H513_9FUNG|nr:hypothetical protein AYI68_g1632 [Smittium mucronatum]
MHGIEQDSLTISSWSNISRDDSSDSQSTWTWSDLCIVTTPQRAQKPKKHSAKEKTKAPKEDLAISNKNLPQKPENKSKLGKAYINADIFLNDPILGSQVVVPIKKSFHETKKPSSSKYKSFSVNQSASKNNEIISKNNNLHLVAHTKFGQSEDSSQKFTGRSPLDDSNGLISFIPIPESKSVTRISDDNDSSSAISCNLHPLRVCNSDSDTNSFSKTDRLKTFNSFVKKRDSYKEIKNSNLSHLCTNSNTHKSMDSVNLPLKNYRHIKKQEMIADWVNRGASINLSRISHLHTENCSNSSHYISPIQRSKSFKNLESNTDSFYENKKNSKRHTSNSCYSYSSKLCDNNLSNLTSLVEPISISLRTSSKPNYFNPSNTFNGFGDKNIKSSTTYQPSYKAIDSHNKYENSTESLDIVLQTDVFKTPPLSYSLLPSSEKCSNLSLSDEIDNIGSGFFKSADWIINEFRLDFLFANDSPTRENQVPQQKYDLTLDEVLESGGLRLFQPL